MSYSFVDRTIVEDPNATTAVLIRERPSNASKWWLAILVGVLYFIIASNLAYGITNVIFHGYLCTGPTFQGCGSTLWGLILHSILFVLIVRLLLN